MFSTAAPAQRIPRPWPAMVGSVVLHLAAAGTLAGLASATVAVVAPAPETALHFVRVLPSVPVAPPRRLPPIAREQLRLAEIPPPRPAPPPPEPERVEARSEPAPPAPEPPAETVVEPPKVQKTLTVGSFDPTGNSTRAPEAARPVVAAGFDSQAARTPDMRMATAAVGGFEQARGPARTGTDRANVVGDAGFGAGVSTGRGRGGAGGVVTSGGFGAAASGGGGRVTGTVTATDFDAKTQQQTVQAAARAPRETPLEILSKPTPAYTDEARQRRIEGEVLLEVEFTAASEVRVLRVVRGLGHGLDESATRAAAAMRFKPAQRDGQPVDVRTTVTIVFRLA